MTSKSKSRTTKDVAPTNPPEPTLISSLENWDLFPTTAEPFELPLKPGEYVRIGRCGVCLRHIEAIQPGGLQPRHCEDQSPLCSEKDRRK